MSAEGPPEALCPSRVCRQHRLNRRENPGGSARSPCSAGTQAETNRSIGSGCINDRGHLPPTHPCPGPGVISSGFGLRCSSQARVSQGRAFSLSQCL